MILMLSLSHARHCHVAHGQGYNQRGLCYVCCGGGGLLSRFQHVLVGYCLSSTERVYEFARLSCCG